MSAKVLAYLGKSGFGGLILAELVMGDLSGENSTPGLSIEKGTRRDWHNFHPGPDFFFYGPVRWYICGS